MDDRQIVDLYWQRDEHAIEATAAKYESYCMKISQNILSDRADSEENVNDTYLHAWQAMPPQRPAILSAFLGKIARNLALNRYKARSAQKRQGDAFALSLEELDDCAPALSSPDDEAMIRFRDTLTAKGIQTTIRASRGEDIQAACGLLSTAAAEDGQ